MVVADSDTRIISYKKPDSIVHRLFELDRGSGLIRVGDGAIGSGLNVRLGEVLPEISLENSTLPFQ